MNNTDSYYEGASPIVLLNGIVFTERSGFGKWGSKSRKGMFEVVNYVKCGLSINVKAVEIGCYAGEMSQIMATSFDKVYCVDPWKNGYDKNDLSSEIFPMDIVEKSFDFRVSDFDNVTKLKMTSREAVENTEIIQKDINFVYIDSIHRYNDVKEEILRWKEKLTIKGSIIGGHDFCGYWGEVVDAVIDTVGSPHHIFSDKSWIKYLY